MSMRAKESVYSIAPYVGGKSKAAGASRVIKLSSNENPFGPSPRAIEAYRDAAASLHRYPDGAHETLRKAIAETHGLQADRLICGAGSDELIGLLVHAYAEPGSEVLYSEHGFLMYRIYTLAAGATPVVAPETNLTADVDALLASVTPRTRILFLANPNNPTGSLLPASEILRLRQHLPSHVILALDGAYAEYVGDADYEDGRALVEAGTPTIMLRTFSKIYGLAALRVGWAYAPVEIIDAMNRIRGPFNVSSPALAAAAAAMRDTVYTSTMRAHNDQWLPKLMEGFAALGLRCFPSAGNFFLVEFPREGRMSTAEVAKYLLPQGIIVRDTVAYGLAQHLRISIGTAEENETLLSAMAAYAKHA